jgi:23S rRNA (cytidine1920-2'-O)/16S rRNA (cytidine1409-2'-O)-methyltransferase
VIRSTVAFAEETGFLIRGLDYSPIRGPEGNIEYLLFLEKPAAAQTSDAEQSAGAEHIAAIVSAAHGELDQN